MARILIVDDDVNIREMFFEFFDQFGHTVMTARDGVEGYELFKKGKFDIGIFDVDMPRMNGLELTKKIKDEAPEFPIILLTAYSHLYNPSDVLLLGVEAFLRKPVDIQKLVDIVDQAIKKS
jgi:YesN/AraC family two-component response regulator